MYEVLTSIKIDTMIQINCYPSPFVFQPLENLLKQINWLPQELDDYLTLFLIDPRNKEYKAYRKESHLTDAQDQENQLRFLTGHETERKLRNLARKVVAHLEKEQLVFNLEPRFELSDKLLFFIQQLNLFLPGIARIEFKIPASRVLALSAEEELFFSSTSIKVERAEEIINIASDCMYAGDYWTAINFLLAIRDLPLPQYTTTEIFEKLAFCHRVMGDIFEATFYNEAALRSGNFKQRNRARYSLAMLNLKNYPMQFKRIELAEKYLQEAYAEMEITEYDPQKKEVDLIFNRNGYALVLYRKGQVEEAVGLVNNGITRLDEIDTSYAKFHQSVLYYNLFQCNQAEKEYELAEKNIKHLISTDKKYPQYYIHLANFYARQSKTKKAIESIETGIEEAADYYRLYYFLGFFRYVDGQLERAITAFKKALELNPADLGSLAYLTSIYSAQNDFDTVRKYTEQFEVAFCNTEHGEIIFNNQITAILQDLSPDNTAAFQNMIDTFERINPDSFVLEAFKELQ